MKKLKLFFALFAMLALGVVNTWGAEKITDYSKIVTGKTYYIGATTGGTDYYLSVSGAATSTSIAGTAKTDKANATAFVFTGSGTSWTIKFADYANYLGLKSSKDNGKVQVVSSAATFTASNQSEKLRLSIGSYSIQKNNSGTQFGSYGNTQTDIWLEEVPGSSEPTTQYTIKWHTAKGVTTDVTLSEGATITKPATEPTMTGYEFMGWTDQCNVATDGVGFTPLTNFGTADSDIDFYAVFAVAETTGGGGTTTETLKGSDLTYSGNNGYVAFTATTASGTWSGKANYNTGGYIQINKNANNYHIGSPTFAGNVESVKITTTNNSATNRTFYIRSSNTTAQPTSGDLGSYKTTAANQTFTIDLIADAKQFYIYSSGAVYISQIDVTYGGGSTSYNNYITTCSGSTPIETLTDAQFAWSAATAEATMGASNTFPTLTNTLPVSVTYESSTTATATIDATSGAITLVAPGATTISAKFAGGEVSGTTYAPKTVTYTLTVNKAPATPTGTMYVKVTDAVTDGEYLIVYEDAANNPQSPVAFNGALTTLDAVSNNIAVAISSNTIAGNTDIDAATFTIDATAKTVKSKSGYYIGQTSDANGLKANNSTKYENALSIENDGTATIKSGGAYLRYNSDANNWRFRYYKSSSYSGQKAIALYKKASSHTLTYGTCTNGSVSANVADGATVLSGTTITLSNTPTTDYKLAAYDVYKTGDNTTKVTVTDDTFIMPEFDVTISATFVPAKTLTEIKITTPATQTTFWQGETFNHNGLKVTAHFDGAADEVVTPTVTGSTATAGTQTVTVSYEEGSTTKTATYNITVKAIPNTKETAYSVAEAYDIIDKLTTAEGVFIKGIISQVDSYNSTYKSITYWISADGTTTNQLQVYSGKGLESADFSGKTDLSVGDQVIVCGNLKKYSGTYEFDKNNYLASHTPTTKDPAGLAYATTSYTANVGEAFATPELTNPYGLPITYSTSDASKATVDANTGAVTIVAAGVVTITAATTGDATHAAGTASYTITISNPAMAVATLPFTFNSGKADIENTAGMSQTGLETDYGSAPKLKFNGAGDNVIVHFDSQAGEFSFVLKQNGQNAGTFTVYESANGEDYSSVWAGGDFGNAQSETIKPTLSESARYVKFEYTTKGASTNYGLGSISIQKADHRAEAGIAWNPATISLTVGDAFTAPTFNNPNGLSGITFASSNEALAAVNNAGVITLVSGKTGTATITATYAGNEFYKAAEVACVITVSPKSEKVVILAEYNGQWYALKNVEETAGKVLAALEVTYFNGTLYNVADADKATIEWQRAAVTDGIIFKNGENYIYGTAGSTDLKLSTTECAWTLDGSTYKIGNRTFIYRAQASGFKNYNATTTPGTDDYSALPVVTAPVYATGDIVYTRDVTPGNLGTICLPFNVPAGKASGATFYTLAGMDANGRVAFDEVTGELAAGVPYLFQANAAEIVCYCGTTSVLSPDDTGAMKGTFVNLELIELSNIYYFAKNALWSCEDLTEFGLSVPANRAYVNMAEVTAITEAAPVGVRRITLGVNGQNTATGVDQVEGDNVPTKMIINGQLFILRGEKMYDAQGKLVK